MLLQMLVYLFSHLVTFCRCLPMGWFFREDGDQGLLIFSLGDLVTVTCMTSYRLLLWGLILRNNLFSTWQGLKNDCSSVFPLCCHMNILPFPYRTMLLFKFIECNYFEHFLQLHCWLDLCFCILFLIRNVYELIMSTLFILFLEMKSLDICLTTRRCHYGEFCIGQLIFKNICFLYPTNLVINFTECFNFCVVYCLS